jgi:two-component system phosphate regulon response regulator OmpR
MISPAAMSSRLAALLIEDDSRLAALVAEYLGKNDVDVTIAGDGESGLAMARGKTRFDIVLLDLMLPRLGGLEVCKRLRAEPHLADVGIIMITAKGDDVDKVVGLEIGADDYVPKPFNPRELLARVRAVTRRLSPPGPGVKSRLRVGDLDIDFAGREVLVFGKRVVLTHYEFELLALLARSAGRVLSRDQILEALRGQELDAFDRSIDVHISKLRAKIEPSPKEPRYIKTVRGVGYVLSRESE